MTENPYESPSAADSPVAIGSPFRNVHPRLVSRPIGIAILTALHLLGGLLLFALQFLIVANLHAMEESLRSIGIHPGLLFAGTMFLSLLAIASAVGMWIGRKWGWWLAAFYYAYGIFRNASAVVMFASMADEVDSAGRGAGYYMVKHGVRTFVHLLLFLYFFKGNVLDFFGMQSVSKAKAIGIIVGICTAITLATTAINFLSGWAS